MKSKPSTGRALCVVCVTHSYTPLTSFFPGRPNQHIGDAGVNTDAGVATDAGVKSPASPQTSVSSVHALSDLTNRCTCVVKTDPSHLQVTLARYFTRI